MTMTKSEKKEQEKTPSKDGDETQKQEEKITPIKVSFLWFSNKYQIINYYMNLEKLCFKDPFLLQII